MSSSHLSLYSGEGRNAHFNHPAYSTTLPTLHISLPSRKELTLWIHVTPDGKWPRQARVVVAARQMGAGESVLILFLTQVSGGDEIFRTRPDRPWGRHSLLYHGYRVSFPGVKRLGRGADHPQLSSAEVIKSTAIPILPFWAFMACSWVNFTRVTFPPVFWLHLYKFLTFTTLDTCHADCICVDLVTLITVAEQSALSPKHSDFLCRTPLIMLICKEERHEHLRVTV
jgi:hypothetical protein